MSIHRIVLTGGPCAGKSTGLSRIEQELSDRGYKVFVVSETATELITGGIKPTEMPLVLFQKAIFDVQSAKEKAYDMVSSSVSDKNVVIVFDRGLLDSKSFMTRKEFQELLKLVGRSEIEIRDSYNGIFHLKTAADGAEKFYTLGNNSARSESPELARSIDKKCIKAWTGHPHLRVIDNSTGFEEKIDRLMTEIYSLLGDPIPTEIERKFLISMPNLKELVEKYAVSKVDIIQTYLIGENSAERRIRQRGSDGSYSYYYTEKCVVTDMSRVETEKKISQTEYLNYMMEADTSLKQIRKDRYCFIYENNYVELDIYPFWSDYAIVEVEVTNESDEIKLPPELNVIKEVTADLRFKNYSLAKNTDIL